MKENLPFSNINDCFNCAFCSRTINISAISDKENTLTFKDLNHIKQNNHGKQIISYSENNNKMEKYTTYLDSECSICKKLQNKSKEIPIFFYCIKCGKIICNDCINEHLKLNENHHNYMSKEYIIKNNERGVKCLLHPYERDYDIFFRHNFHICNKCLINKKHILLRKCDLDEIKTYKATIDKLKGIIENLENCKEKKELDLYNKLISKNIQEENKENFYNNCKSSKNININLKKSEEQNYHNNQKGEIEELKKSEKYYKTTLNKKFPIDENEKIFFIKIINKLLENDQDCKDKLPINSKTDEIFEKFKDGVIFTKLINLIETNIIDQKSIIIGPNISRANKEKNLNLILNVAKKVGCIFDTTVDDILYEFKKNIHDLVFQILKSILLKKINIKECPKLLLLKNEKENEKDFLSLKSEDLLIRWFNYHLKKSNYPKMLTNFGEDIKNSEKYIYLLSQLYPNIFEESILEITDINKRAEIIIHNCKKIGVDVNIIPEDIINGNENLNLFFIIELFNYNHGMDKLNEDEKIENMELLDDEENFYSYYNFEDNDEVDEEKIENKKLLDDENYEEYFDRFYNSEDYNEIDEDDRD